MRRSFKQIVSEGYRQFINDIRQIKWAIIAIIAYFVFVRKIVYSLCPVVTFTGFPCPGCGMTRAGIRLLHMDFKGAWQMHPFIYAIVVLVALYCWNRYICQKMVQPGYMKVLFGIMLCGMVVFYIYRMICYFPGNPPMSYYSNNVLHFIKKNVIYWLGLISG